VAELVYAADLKSAGLNNLVGSSPTSPTIEKGSFWSLFQWLTGWVRQSHAWIRGREAQPKLCLHDFGEHRREECATLVARDSPA
jgi:hypothetical protein